MTQQEKARIREIQKELHNIRYYGSEHTADEAEALEKAIDALEKSVEWTT